MPRLKNKKSLSMTFWVIMIPLFTLVMSLLVLETLFNIFVGRIYGIVLKWLNEHYYYYSWLRKDLADCESILELGCGSDSPLLKIGYGYKTHAIDIWEPYVKKHIVKRHYGNCTQDNILTMRYPTKSVDAIVICDVLEHLEKRDVHYIELFHKLEKCAKKKVIIFTPNGFIENDTVDGDPYQAHVSAWEPEDFQKRGYSVFGATGFRWLFRKASLPKHPQVVFYALGMLSQPMVYHFPKLARHSYAVKELK